MDIGAILNAAITQTLLTVILGGFIAALISERWQRKRNRNQLRMDELRQIVSSYQRYFRLLQSDDLTSISAALDDSQVRLLSHGKISPIVFDMPGLDAEFGKLVSRLANARDLRSKDQKESANGQLVEATLQFQRMLGDLQQRVR